MYTPRTLNADTTILYSITTATTVQLKIRDIIFSRSRVMVYFVRNFVAMATGVRWQKICFAAFDGPSPKTPYRCKDLADIFYKTRVIAHFVSNFITMATRIGGG